MILQPKFFILEADRLTLFPRVVWKTFGYALVATYSAIGAALITGPLVRGSLNLSDLQFMAEIAVFFLFLVALFWYYGSRKIVIDASSGTVRCEGLPGRTIISFADIQGLGFVATPAASGFYRLVLKKDPYGAGIKLHFPYRDSSKQAAQLREIVVPKIKALLSRGAAAPTESATQDQAPAPASSRLVMFKRNVDGTYSTGFWRTGALLLSLLFLAAGLYLCIWMRSYTGLIALAGFVVNLQIWLVRIRLDPGRQTLERSYAGLFKRSYGFRGTAQISTTRHLMYGLWHAGTDLALRVQNACSSEKVVLFGRLSNTRKISVLVAEMATIMGG